MQGGNADVELSIEREDAAPEELAQVVDVGDLRSPVLVSAQVERVDDAVAARREHGRSHHGRRPHRGLAARGRQTPAAVGVGKVHEARRVHGLLPLLGVAGQADGMEVAAAGGVVKVPVGDDGVGEDVLAEEDLSVDFERAGLIERERLAGVGGARQIFSIEGPIDGLRRGRQGNARGPCRPRHQSRLPESRNGHRHPPGHWTRRPDAGALNGEARDDAKAGK
jgi:hypothetical protein